MAKKEEKQILLDVDKMSLNKKLFVLREAIDLLKLGIEVDSTLVDRIYDDLITALEDYDYCKYVMYNEKVDGPASKKDLEPLPDDLDLDDLDDNTPIFENDTVKLTKKLYGKDYTKLLESLDDLADDSGTSYEVYMYPNEDRSNVKLKIWDPIECKVKRIYDDPGDLQLNFEQDIKTQFNRKKTKLSKLKLSDKKEQNRE